MSLRLLVTYGTLMRPFDRQATFGVEETLSFLGRSQWDGHLFDLGAYPGAVPGSGTVHGELYRVGSARAWDVLDRYEGYDPEREDTSLFIRRKVALEVPEDRMAWVYWYNGEPSWHTRVPSGDWREYTERMDSR